jgi:hypothetical protein
MADMGQAEKSLALSMFSPDAAARHIVNALEATRRATDVPADR